MSAATRMRVWLRGIFRSDIVHREVETEFQFHVDAYAADLVRSGLPPDEARRTAQLELGRVAAQPEKYRAAIGLRPFDEFGADIRFGVRTLWKQPAYSLVAVLSLALGIGATTAMFSLIYAVLLHPFPYAAADRIMNPVVVDQHHPDTPTWFAMTAAQSVVFRKARCIESVLGFTPAQMEITGDALPGNAYAIYLTENAQSFFAVPALRGRGIEPADARTHQAIAVLNYRFWQSHYGGDPRVIGRILQLDRRDYTIVGVMPRSFAFNDTLGTADIYLPRNLLDSGDHPVSSGAWLPWIRLRKNVPFAAANQELDAIVHQFAREQPTHYPAQFHVQLQPIVAPFRQKTGRTLHLLFGAVVLLLLIGCANCSILLLARSAARHRELALRTALGAGRWRILRQLLVESMVVALAGAALGVAASYWLARLPLHLSPTAFPSESVIRVNLPVLLFSVGLALASGFLFGLLPALRLSRPDLNRSIQTRQRSIAGASTGRRFSFLISGQIALTLLLLATAGTAITAFLRTMCAPLGYDPHHVLEAGIFMHWTKPSEWKSIQSRTARAGFVEQIRRKIASIPGVLSVSVALDVYPPNAGSESAVEVQDQNSHQLQHVRTFPVSPQFFATLGIPLLRGRVWNDDENLLGDGVIVVNQSFARRFWPRGDAIGHQIRLPDLVSTAPLMAASPNSSGWRTIVGIVGDARNNGIDSPVLPAVFFPYTTLMPPYVEFHIRTQGAPLASLRAVRAAVASVSSDQQIANGAYDLEKGLAEDPQWNRERLLSTLFGVFSAIALSLALAGIFSVVAYSVAQRTSEFGVRLSLGASRSHILWMSIRTAALSLALGVFSGGFVDLILGRWLGPWMKAGQAGPLALPGSAALLTAGALLACLAAARRTAGVDPMEALRSE